MKVCRSAQSPKGTFAEREVGQAKAAAKLGVWATGESHTFFGHNLTVSSDACASQRVHAFADNDARVSSMEAAGTCLCATALPRRADLNQQNL